MWASLHGSGPEPRNPVVSAPLTTCCFFIVMCIQEVHVGVRCLVGSNSQCVQLKSEKNYCKNIHIPSTVRMALFQSRDEN